VSISTLITIKSLEGPNLKYVLFSERNIETINKTSNIVIKFMIKQNHTFLLFDSAIMLFYAFYAIGKNFQFFHAFYTFLVKKSMTQF